MLEYLRACAGNNEATKPVYCHHLPVIRSQYSTKYQPIMRPDSVIVSCACFFCILIVSLFCNHHHHHHYEEDQNRGKMKWDRMIVERQISSFPIEMEREMYCSVSFLSEWMVVGVKVWCLLPDPTCPKEGRRDRFYWKNRKEIKR